MLALLAARQFGSAPSGSGSAEPKASRGPPAGRASSSSSAAARDGGISGPCVVPCVCTQQAAANHNKHQQQPKNMIEGGRLYLHLTGTLSLTLTGAAESRGADRRDGRRGDVVRGVGQPDLRAGARAPAARGARPRVDDRGRQAVAPSFGCLAQGHQAVAGGAGHQRGGDQAVREHGVAPRGHRQAGPALLHLHGVRRTRGSVGRDWGTSPTT